MAPTCCRRQEYNPRGRGSNAAEATRIIWVRGNSIVRVRSRLGVFVAVARAVDPRRAGANAGPRRRGILLHHMFSMFADRIFAFPDQGGHDPSVLGSRCLESWTSSTGV